MKRVARRLFGPSPLGDLARVHVLSTMADAFVTVSLAGSLFFNVSLDASRLRIALYLVITMAPFAVLAPLVGPVIDRVRGGHRVVLAVACASRGGVCLLVAGHLQDLLFYPEVFTVLVLGKTYSVAKSALVPRLVDDDAALVEANSRLTRMSLLGGSVGGMVAVGVLALASVPTVLQSAAIVYLGAVLLALRLPQPQPRRRRSPPSLEREALHAPSVVLDALALTALRGSIGLMAFHFAFVLKRTGAPTWFYGVAFAASALGAALGTVLAPKLRRAVSETRMLALALATPAFFALIGAIERGRGGMLAAVFALGTGATVGRQAFDSLLQVHAPDADRARAFARFETQFQLAWVAGALVPVVVAMPRWAGLLLLAAILGAASVIYITGSQTVLRRGAEPVPLPSWAWPATDGVEELPLPLEVLLTGERLWREGSYRQAVVQAVLAVELARAEPTPALTLAAYQNGGNELERLRQEAVRGSDRMDGEAARRAITLAESILGLQRRS